MTLVLTDFANTNSCENATN